MKFTLTITLGNAAMQTGDDVATALREVAKKVERIGEVEEHVEHTMDSVHGNRIGDLNGNKVGVWGFED